MSERERELARQVQDLKRALRAEEEIQRSLRAGYTAQLQQASEDLGKVHDELTLERARRCDALVAVSQVQEHTGAVYRRVREVGDLVTGWERKLPAEFVVAVRALTEPDFAQLLGVPA